MTGKTSFALVLMVVVAAVSTPVHAALVAEWLLDEQNITLDTTTAVDTTGN